MAVSRRSPGASGSGLGFSNGLKQAELENPASDTLCGDYNGNKKTSIVVGERISFKPKTGKRRSRDVVLPPARPLRKEAAW